MIGYRHAVMSDITEGEKGGLPNHYSEQRDSQTPL